MILNNFTSNPSASPTLPNSLPPSAVRTSAKLSLICATSEKGRQFYISPLFYFMQVFKRENFFEEKTVGIKRKNKAFQKSIKKSTLWREMGGLGGGGGLGDEKGNKKMSFLPRQTSKLFDIYFILFVVSIYEIFFPNNFRCIKMSRKNKERSSTTKRTEVSSFLITLHPFFCVCSPALWWRSFEEAFVEAKWFAERAPAHRRSGK